MTFAFWRRCWDASVATETLSEDLKANQVLVQMVAAPITPNDFHEVRVVLTPTCPQTAG